MHEQVQTGFCLWQVSASLNNNTDQINLLLNNYQAEKRERDIKYYFLIFILLTSPQGQGHHNSVSQLLSARKARPSPVF